MQYQRAATKGPALRTMAFTDQLCQVYWSCILQCSCRPGLIYARAVNRSTRVKNERTWAEIVDCV
jgi:hypothetical protein